ncbi:chromate efflux transporter [Thalassococcus sp. S3]|uniref:chromate efflux transporter n=1 Tax=Thalassococcus sp. S3 TaxID=2017482 RepID=UPI0020C23AE3|nr:chromate efflux transporter [Thalassococcus sp. S3]
MNTPTRSDLFYVFGRIGLLSFGGPAAQIALMHRELVEERPWLDEKTFLRALSLCMLLPGPEAMQLATYAGWRLHGVWGGLIAGLLFVLPGAIVIAALVALYAAFGDVPLIQAAFVGIKAAVIVIVLQALYRVAHKALTGATAIAMAGLAFLAIFIFDLPFPLIILTAAVWGYLTAKGTRDPKSRPSTSTPMPWRTALFCAAAWLVPLGILSVAGPPLLAQIGWFFAKLAVVTFGGAYAVLAYMTQTVAFDFNWISTEQMIDALGLAETTPGPLILVTQFVAMLTGYLQNGPAMAIAAGLVALWATFVPCFLWIFVAGPYLDLIADRPRLSSALAGITAAVVGVILNLSVWFALHVLFAEVVQWSVGPIRLPVPVWSSLQFGAGLLVALAAALMLGARLGLAQSLGILALAGIGLSLI